MYFISEIVRFLGLIIEYVGLFFIAVSVFVALFRFPMKKYTMESLRIYLARRIIFGLEFIIAADIMLATVTVGLTELVQLGGIVIIRVVLGYSIRKEILRR